MKNKYKSTPFDEYTRCWDESTGNLPFPKSRYLILAVFSVVLLALCVLYILFGYGFDARNTYGGAIKEFIKDEPIKINDYKDLKSKLVGKIVLNNTYELQEDIIIPADEHITIGTAEYPFTGIFNGQNHTISYSYKAEDSVTSLFGYTSNKAQINELTVKGSLNLADGDVGAAIVKYNYGTVSDCKVADFSISVDNYAIAGGIAAYNYGTIERCSVSMSFSKSGSDGIMKTCFGGLCAKNSEGEIKDRVGCDITFSGFVETDMFGNYDGFDGGNFYMGAAIGLNEGQIKDGTLYVADRGAYLSDRSFINLLSLEEYRKLFG